jgi:hypothetical protein
MASKETTTMATALALSAEGAFLGFGAQRIAYLRTVHLADGDSTVVIFSAEGLPMAAATSIEAAQVLCRQNDLEPALVH